METINIFESSENNNISKGELNLELNKDTTINLFNSRLKLLNILINDNVIVNINDFSNIINEKLKIVFNIKSNSLLNYNLSNIVNNDLNMEIIINYLGNDSKVDVNIHSLVKGNEKIKIDGIVKSDNKDNELLENVKVILVDDGKCEVVPNMLIDTNKVLANHKVAISNIRNDELFYLMCKGLSKEISINLIKKSFLVSNIKDNELKNKISEVKEV